LLELFDSTAAATLLTAEILPADAVPIMFSAFLSKVAVAENGLFLLLFFKPSFGEVGVTNGEHTLTDI
jgi:hypothetical protein